MSRCIALIVAAVALLGALPACGVLQPMFRELGVGGDDPKWVEWKYRGVSSTTALQLAQNAVQSRYPANEVDLHRGTLSSGWVYGRYADVTHQALRSRVRVEAEPEGDDLLLVRMRVQQETSETAGRYVSHDPGDWQPFEDDPTEAHRLMTKLHVLLSQLGERVQDPPPDEEAAK
jgi:hypothetical protein